MTIHSYGEWYSNYQCPKCEAYYIPFSKEVSCPNCGDQQNKENDFIDLAVASLEFNMVEFQSYVPGAWYTGCYSDHVLSLVFDLFELHRTQNKDNVSFESFANKYIDEMEFGDQEYGRNYLRQIVAAVWDKMKDKKTINGK